MTKISGEQASGDAELDDISADSGDDLGASLIEPPADGQSAGGLPADEVEQLITSNLGLAYHMAKSWAIGAQGKRLEKDDVDAQAIAGLVKAANTWKKGSVPFAVYARRVIKNWLHHQDWHAGRYSTVQKDWLDAPAGGQDDSDSTMHDKAGAAGDTADDDLSKRTAKDMVHAAIEDLASPVREILKDWLFNGRTYREMAADYGISHVQVGNLARSGIERVKAALAAKGVSSLSDIWPESVDGCRGQFVAEILTSAVAIHHYRT